MKHKHITKILSCLLSAVIAIGTLTLCASASNDTFETAEQAIGNIGAGWNLGNALDSTGEWIVKWTERKPENFETAWGNPVTTKALISAVKKAGFNAIRVPVTWEYHTDDKGNIDKAWLDRVSEVVDYVVSQDMYCILNVHHDAGSDGWLEASSDSYKANSGRFEGLWKNIAVRFKDYGEKLMFESFNEMLDKDNSWTDAKNSDAYKAINDFNALFVKTVRAVGGNNSQRNLMLQVYSASCSEKALDGFSLPEDTVRSHLIIQVHNYDPQGFTATDATWTTMTDKWGTAAEKQYFDKLFEQLGKFSEKQGTPLVVGEFGANYKGNESSRTAYAEYFVRAAAKYGIKCFWWDTGGMALFDREKAEAKYPDVIKALVSIKGVSTENKTDVSQTVIEKLKAPVVKTSVTGKKATLKWDKIDGAVKYRVYRYDASSKKYVRILTTTSTSCKLNFRKSGTYRFVVCAVA
ncbi:MAG: glycoside hydrolase family 5 protein, partial [Oscillospiraceae bacterium]|nr:glycoside hydrolase family 5 protein [Oscillospiraceae bacterium]